MFHPLEQTAAPTPQWVTPLGPPHRSQGSPVLQQVIDTAPCFSDAHLQTQAAWRWAGRGPVRGPWLGERPAEADTPSAPGPPGSVALPEGGPMDPPTASGGPAAENSEIIRHEMNKRF